MKHFIVPGKGCMYTVHLVHFLTFSFRYTRRSLGLDLFIYLPVKNALKSVCNFNDVKFPL